MFPNTLKSGKFGSFSEGLELCITAGGEGENTGGEEEEKVCVRACERAHVCVSHGTAAAISPLLSRCWVQCLIDSFYSSSVRLGQLKGVTTHGCEQ